MDASYCVGGPDMDFGRMFDQYLHKDSDNLDLNFSIPDPTQHQCHTNDQRHPQQGYSNFDTPSEPYPDMAPLPPPFNQQVANSTSSHPSSHLHHQQTSLYQHQMAAMHAANNPQFPPQNLYIPPISQHALLASQTSGYHPYLSGVGGHGAPVYTSAGLPLPSTPSPMMNVGGMLQHSPYYHHAPRPPINHNGGSPISVGSPSPNSDDSDDSTPIGQMNRSKRPTAEVPENNKKKTKVTKKNKKKKDPNEPQKPVSAYALFFRDTQATIKGTNPNASFGEVSKIVASMWDTLDAENKGIYKKKTEAAKKEYLKALAAYRASLVSSGDDNVYNPGYGQYGAGPSYGYPPTSGAAVPTPGHSPPQLSPMAKKSPLLSSLMANEVPTLMTPPMTQPMPPSGSQPSSAHLPHSSSTHHVAHMMQHGHMPSQSKLGHITPQSNPGHMSQHSASHIGPQSNSGHITPQSGPTHATSQPTSGHVTPQPNPGHLSPQTSSGQLTPQPNPELLNSQANAAHGNPRPNLSPHSDAGQGISQSNSSYMKPGPLNSPTNSGHFNPQSNNSGHMNPQSSPGQITPQSNSGQSSPNQINSQSNSGHMNPQTNSLHMNSQSNSGHLNSQSNSGHLNSQSNSGHMNLQSNSGHLNIHSSSGHMNPQSNSGHLNSLMGSGHMNSHPNSGHMNIHSNSIHMNPHSNSGAQPSVSHLNQLVNLSQTSPYLTQGGNPSLGSSTGIGSAADGNSSVLLSNSGQASHSASVKSSQQPLPVEGQQNQQQAPQQNPSCSSPQQMSQGQPPSLLQMERQVQSGPRGMVSSGSLTQQQMSNASSMPTHPSQIISNVCAKTPGGENDWDEDYSNQIVVNHCRNVYQDWVSPPGSEGPQTYPGPVK